VTSAPRCTRRTDSAAGRSQHTVRRLASLQSAAAATIPETNRYQRSRPFLYTVHYKQSQKNATKPSVSRGSHAVTRLVTACWLAAANASGHDGLVKCWHLSAAAQIIRCSRSNNVASNALGQGGQHWSDESVQYTVQKKL